LNSENRNKNGLMPNILLDDLLHLKKVLMVVVMMMMEVAAAVVMMVMRKDDYCVKNCTQG